MKTGKNKPLITWLILLSLCGAPFAVNAQTPSQQLPASTLPSASATTTAPPAPTSQMPLMPKLPAIEQLTQFIFPSVQPKKEAEIPAPERLVRALVNHYADMHFSLTDYAKREEFKKKWFERATKVKTLEEADKLNEEILVSLGQRFDYYRKPVQVEQSKKRSDPTFVGIGAMTELRGADEIIDGLPEDAKPEDVEKLMTVTAERPFVLNPYKDSPAAQAGVQKGDVLLKIDGKDIIGKTQTEIIALVRGKEGTKVELTVERRDKDGKVVATKPFEVVRAKYTAPVVHVRTLADGVTYIKLDNFVAARASEEMLAAFQEAAKVKDGKIVLDLRDNGGGRLDHAINIVSYMLREGTIVTLRKRDSHQLIRETFSATLDGVFHTRPAGWNASQLHYSASGRILAVPPTMPIVVLVNEWSASASELAAGALKFHGRAKIVGQNTLGKGVGQVVVQLPDGRETSITTFYFDPADREIDFEGIAPDKEVALAPTYEAITKLRAELRGVLKNITEQKDEKELEKLRTSEKEIRSKLAVLHKELREDDAQLREARLLAVEESKRITKEEADKKAKRDAMFKKKMEEWEKERQQREENLNKKGASAASGPST